MSDYTPGTPALSPEQWGDANERAAVWGALMPPAERHQVAALALHGQPFGFTWEDVDDLTDIANAIKSEGSEWTDGYHERVRSLAQRIADLLPQRQTLATQNVSIYP